MEQEPTVIAYPISVQYSCYICVYITINIEHSGVLTLYIYNYKYNTLWSTHIICNFNLVTCILKTLLNRSLNTNKLYKYQNLRWL